MISARSMKIVALIQARMGSTRLPGKVLAELGGASMLAQVVARVRLSQRVNLVAVATSREASDDPIAEFCHRADIAYFRGSERDVLDRYREGARFFAADTVVRLTADCPLLDPAIIDRVVNEFFEHDVDYASNVLNPTFPDGLDVEVFKATALELAWQRSTKPSEREHVTPYLRLAPEFRRWNVESGFGPEMSKVRWTVDEPQDLEFVRKIYAELAGRCFGMRDVLQLLQINPGIQTMQHGAIMNEGYYRSLYGQAIAGAAPRRPLQKSEEWFTRAQRVIPGGAQTFSKGYTQYVRGVAPIFLQRGAGCRVWDVDGNEYIDYVQGLLPNILGYAHAEVNAAVVAQLEEGYSFSLPHPMEVLLAERLTRLIPCAEMVRFGKNGSDATAGAIRAARAVTGRDRIACCGYHGWQDWYIGSTARHRGVPGAVRALTHPFVYNDLQSLRIMLEQHRGEFAAVIMEPVNFIPPAPNFLADVKELAHQHGALLIYDEICTGFHLGLGGAQKRLGVIPDLACFGKAMGNGFPIACVVGRADIMKIFEEIFFSFTFGGEVASFAACLKVLDILEQTDALSRMEANGRRLQDGFNALAAQAGLAARFQCIGYPVWSLIKFRDADGKDSFLERSLWQQEVVKRGVLQLVTHNLSAAHDAAAIEQTLEAYAAVFRTLEAWLADANPARFLQGPMIQPVFRVR